MRTKNELYQEALRTIAARRQMARARAEDARALSTYFPTTPAHSLGPAIVPVAIILGCFSK